MADPNRDEIARLELLHRAHPDGLIFPHLAEAYRRDGQLDKAEDILLQGLSRQRDNSSAHIVLGRVRLDKGETDAAQTSFRQVLQLDPDNAVALRALADLALRTGHFDEALNHYRHLQRLYPLNDEVTARLAEAERQAQGEVPAPEARAPGKAPTTPATEAPGAPGRVSRAQWPPLRMRPDRGVTEQGGTHGPTRSSEISSGHEPDEVYTETMAELYQRQGLHDRAVRIYRRLLRAHPGDRRLEARLEEAEIARRLAAQTEPEEEQLPTTVSVPVQAEPPERPTIPQAPTARSYLSGLLTWENGRERQAENGGRRPAVSTPRERGKAPPRPSPVAEREEPWPWEEPVAEDKAAAPDSAAPGVRPETQRRAPRWPSPERAAPPGAGPAEPLSEKAPALPPQGTTSRLHPDAEAVLAITDLLVGLLEYRDPFFRGGSSLTRLLAAAVGRELGLGEPDVHNLALAAVLRDLGRLALGGKLVTEPQAARTPEARRRIERHVDLALQLMEGINLPASIRYAVRHHHERWDGRGYPDGLAGAEIPLSARILAVVDSFAAMVAARPYRLPRKVPEAASELQSEAGTRYDPDVVSALMRVLARRDHPSLGFVLRQHILIVSPDQPGATVTAAKLCSAGYLAEVAPDVVTAKDRLRRVPVAAVVVGAELMNGDAIRFIRELRSDPKLGQLPVVVIDAPRVEERVKLLENGADVCFAPEASYSELHGTLGALIRRAFRQRTGGAEGMAAESGTSPWLALQGDIQDFPLSWLLQVMKYDGRTAAIGIRTTEALGVVYLERGDARHAQIRGGPKGEPALRQMLGWRKGHFTVEPDAHLPERTITTSITHLLLDQAVAEDHAAAGEIFGAVKADQ
ncbi:MAG: HD domain-containing phosphohydrolase [Gemmatimonadota bacterium]